MSLCQFFVLHYFSVLHTQTHQHSLELGFCHFVVMLCETAFGDHFLSPLFGILGALFVDVFFPLPSGCEDTAFSIHDGEHSTDTGCSSSGSIFRHNTGFAHSESCTVVAVPGKNSQITADSSADHTLHITFKEQSVWCSDSQRESTYRTFPPLLILRFFKHFIDGFHKQEITLRNVITLTVQDHPESSQCLLQWNIFARHT